MRLLNVAQAATEAHRHEDTIRDALRSGELRGGQRKKGGHWTIRDTDLEAWAMGVAA